MKTKIFILFMSFNLFYGHHNGQNKICHFKPVIESNIKRSYSPKTFMFLDSVAFNDVSSEQTFVTSNVSTDACSTKNDEEESA